MLPACSANASELAESPIIWVFGSKCLASSESRPLGGDDEDIGCYRNRRRAAARVRIRYKGPGKGFRRRGENRHARGHIEHAREVESRRGPAVRSHRPAAQLHLK
jgi:hypothetical protein